MDKIDELIEFHSRGAAEGTIVWLANEKPVHQPWIPSPRRPMDDETPEQETELPPSGGDLCSRCGEPSVFIVTEIEPMNDEDSTWWILDAKCEDCNRQWELGVFEDYPIR